MPLESEQNMRSTNIECELLNLPWELRDTIWAIIADEDLARTSPLLALTTCSLLAVSRQVRDEVSSVFLRKQPFFKSSWGIATFLGCKNVHRRRRFTKDHHPGLWIALTVGILSVIPDRLFSDRWEDASQGWHRWMGRRSTLHCSGAHPNAWLGAQPGMARLLSTIRSKRIGLLSLEIPVALLFNISVVRPLRRLRGINLHLAFISERTKLKDLILNEKERLPPSRKWLDETGDIDIILPIYDSPSEIDPIAMAPLARLAAAIRREVASTEPIPISISQLQIDPPLWIEFDSNHAATTNDLPPPSSGWYRYVSHNPGICCLEKTSAPTSPLPRKRKLLKRSRQELGRLSAAPTRSCKLYHFKNSLRIDRSRVDQIRRLSLQGVVIKDE